MDKSRLQFTLFIIFGLRPLILKFFLKGEKMTYTEKMINILGDTLHSYLMEAYMDGSKSVSPSSKEACEYAKVKLKKIIDGDLY